MKKMTEQHLMNAFAGQSMSYMRDLHFAAQAERDRFPNIARLFRAIAHAVWILAGDLDRQLRHLEAEYATAGMGTFGSGSTRKNLRLAILDEDNKMTEMYPAFIAVAKSQQEPDAQRSFEWAVAAGFRHKQLLQKALDAADSSRDVVLGPVQVCQICGYTIEGDAPPEPCPLCKALKDKFVAFA